jgi:hypothetical protein
MELSALPTELLTTTTQMERGRHRRLSGFIQSEPARHREASAEADGSLDWIKI